MAKIARFNGDVRAFGSTATGTDRTIFGDVIQSDTLDANINANFLTGWGILTAGAKPPKQYFNGVLYTATQLIAYLHEVGIPEWNTNQKFYIGSMTLGSDGVVYSSVTGTDPTPNTGTNPATVTNEAVWKIAANPYKEGSITHNLTADADYTLTALQNKYGRIEITDTGVLLTTGRNIILDNVQKRFIFVNSTAQTLTVKTSAGTGIAVAAGETVDLYNDGTNVIRAVDDATYNPTPVIATGSATFTNATNNIALTGVGIGVEIGDVITVSGSTNNDTEFTIEVITDANNVIVNQAHAGGTTTKSLVDETATVTVKLLSKWYNAPIGLGQTWQDMVASRTLGATYTNTTGKAIEVLLTIYGTSTIVVDGIIIASPNNTQTNTSTFIVANGATYAVSSGILARWFELR